VLTLTQEMQEKQIMEMQQVANAMNIQPPPMGGIGMDQASIQGGSPVAGAAGPGQAPDSPNVRRNEVERGEGQGGGANGAQSAAMSQAPNAGAQ
jgi:hypothetical protein